MTAATIRRWLSAMAAAVVVIGAGWLSMHSGSEQEPASAARADLGSPGGPGTARADLESTISKQETILAKKPYDERAAVTLADALLRQARVTGNPGLALRAESALKRVLDQQPDHYDARRMLGAVYLSQHRFRDAIEEAKRSLQSRANDAWTYGVLGDAHLELGEYTEAFDAFDRMAALKPNAASYARSSYAREIQGDIDGALRLMQMSTEATSPQDPESLAWHYAQLGHLYFERGRLDEARRQYEHAAYAFPGHPFATDGLARVAAAEGDNKGALEIVTAQMATAPTPAGAAFAGDLLAALGRPEEAERHYALAESGWRSDAPEPKALVRFLADHDRSIPDAVHTAERASADRSDIWTDDALAWAYFKADRIADARAASRRALRTGSRDREILYHAAAIVRRAGDLAAARSLVSRSLEGQPRFDVFIAPLAAKLHAELNAGSEVAAR